LSGFKVFFNARKKKMANEHRRDEQRRDEHRGNDQSRWALFDDPGDFVRLYMMVVFFAMYVELLEECGRRLTGR
jgi:hypothetical protein